MLHTPIIIDFVLLLIGFTILATGANLLVTGAATLAKKCQVSPLVIGATIIAMGTSLPEFIISVTAAMHHNPNLAVGNAIGSNIANITLVLGITILCVPLKIHQSILRKELPILFLVMVMVGTLILDSNLNRFDGILLMCATILLIVWLIYQGFKEKRAKKILEKEYKEEISAKHITRKTLTSIAILQIITGVVLLPMSSQVILVNSIDIAQYFHISNLLIGLTIVSLGTSLPELSTSLVAAKKNAHDIVIGNILGSNILNMLAVLALPAIIRSIDLPGTLLLRDFILMFAMTMVLYLFAFFSHRKARNLRRLEGVILLTGYVTYIFSLYYFR